MHPKVSMEKHKFVSSIIVFIWICLMTHPLVAAEQNAKNMDGFQGKKIALVIPYGRYNRYLHEEFMGAFEPRGIKVSIVSSQMGMATPNKGEIMLTVERTIDQVDMAEYDALVFTGGGALYSEFANKPKTQKVIKQAVRLNKVIAGLDLGKAVLVSAGLIDYQIPKDKDAIGAAVTVSGRVITGNSTYVVQPFIASLLKVLKQE